MSSSLEDEQKAILERMSASRRNYQLMFAHEEDSHRQADDAHAFPRSHTFKFLTRHPYHAALAALAVVAVLPRGSLKKTVKGSAVVTAGILSDGMKTVMMRRILPIAIHLLRSNKRCNR